MSRPLPMAAARIACVSLTLFSLSAFAGPSPANRLQDIDVKTVQGQVEIRLKTQLPPTFQSYARRSPAILIVDLVNTQGRNQTLTAPSEAIEEISLEARNDGPTPTTRLWIRLKAEQGYDVEAADSDVKITLFDRARELPKPGAMPGADARAYVAPGSSAKVALRQTPGARLQSDAWLESGQRLAQSDVEDESLEASTAEDEALSDIDPTDAAPESMPIAEGEGAMGMSMGTATRGEIAMTYIGFVNRINESEIYARLNERTGFEVRREGENLMVLEIPRASIPLRNNKNHLDTTFFESPVKMITPTVVEDDESMIRIIIEMKEEVPYESNLQGNDVVLRFKR